MTTKIVERHDTTTVVVECVDTVVLFAPDSATLDALFACDSLNNVYLVQLSQQQGERVNLTPQIKYVYERAGPSATVPEATRMISVNVSAVADSLQAQVHMYKVKYSQACDSLDKAEELLNKKPQLTTLLAFLLLGFMGGALFGMWINGKCNNTN